MAEEPPQCQVLGRVEGHSTALSGSDVRAKAEDGLKYEAASLGANTVVVDDRGSWGSAEYVARGVALHCPTR